MKHILSQFRRMLYDDGRNDKIFTYQKHRLNEAMKSLKDSTDKAIKASQQFQACFANDEADRQQFH